MRETPAPAVIRTWASATAFDGVQVVLAHTPFRRLAQSTPLRDQPVLVAGLGSPADVARHAVHSAKRVCAVYLCALT